MATRKRIQEWVMPTLPDFGLYKCPLCGKMVMGYEKEGHQSEVHKGQEMEWLRLK